MDEQPTLIPPEIMAKLRQQIDRLQCATFVAICNGKPLLPQQQQFATGPWLTFDMLARWRARGFRA